MGEYITVQIMNKAFYPEYIKNSYKPMLRIQITQKNSKRYEQAFTAEAIWMENKPEEKMLNLIVIRKKQIYTTIRFSTQDESDSDKYWWGCEATEFSYAPNAVKITATALNLWFHY